MGAYVLGIGTNNVVTDSAAIAVARGGSGFFWPEQANFAPNNVWTFEGNTAHNNQIQGAFIWQNEHNVHHVNDFTSYRNMMMGINHGAYSNDYHYSNNFLYDNGWSGWTGLDASRGHLAQVLIEAVSSADALPVRQEWDGFSIDAAESTDYIVFLIARSG
jgi:hypothetical protein